MNDHNPDSTLTASEHEATAPVDQAPTHADGLYVQGQVEESSTTDETAKLGAGEDNKPANDRGPIITWPSPTGGLSAGYPDQKPRLPYKYGPGAGGGGSEPFLGDYAC